jgi:hypothetical protein
MDKHLKRDELIALARKQSDAPNPHLSECTECREAYELLKSFQMAGRSRLQDAPNGWIEAATALAQKRHVFESVKKTVAALVFDSWASPQPVGVRGQAALGERRMRFESDQVVFDIRAERLAGKWAFVAQVADKSTPPSPIDLSVDKRELQADAVGLVQWTSGRPPKKILLRSRDIEIEIPELSWKKHRPS